MHVSQGNAIFQLMLEVEGTDSRDNDGVEAIAYHCIAFFEVLRSVDEFSFVDIIS